ncbi:Protein transport protein S9 plasma membrane t-SNARE [Steccherinum ochraceum]|uniref:Protein transport protein S9 plasma membrane t-SNARE n=1 Tax=Steccherinum ochraceum TaxID=92696 RepID=A0A4R0RRR6_9APHY|nr:Protein transport protein S9 plasma membrane t-SNARE [Steccherinum ochraceum]
MSFFKRKDKPAIPPVASEQASRDELFGSRGNSASPRPPRSNATYVPSRDGDMYNTNSSTPSPRPQFTDRYAKTDTVGDVYSRGRGNVDQDRNELFSGYKPQPGGGSGRFFNDGPQDRPEPAAGEENEEDIEGIKQQLRFTKQESVNSTRNALRLAREAEETARGTLQKLGDQSESLANTERHLDVSKGHSQRAEDKTDELKQLNRSIFRPVITFNKDAKRAAQEAKVQQRYDEDREEREKAMTDIRETHDRLGRAQSYGQQDPNSRYKTEAQLAARKEQRKRFQFDATASDDEMEDELDDNLNEISDMTKRLKALGSTMGQELDRQNERIGRITEKTDSLDNRIFRNTKKLERIK